MRDFEFQPLLTTVIGSYPPAGLPPRRAVQRAVEDQIAAGVELISDGQMRGDMIGAFAARIPGFRLADDGTWEVEDALDLPDGHITAGDYALARQLAAGRAEVKGVVTGPITLALSCRVAPTAPYTDSTDPVLLLRLAEILAREVAALVAAGANVVQIDEPALAKALGTRVSPELAYDALRSLVATPRLPALHVCGDIRAVAAELLILPFAVLAFENSRIANLGALDADELDFTTVRLSPGCVDTQSAEVESAAVIGDRIRAVLERIEAERVWVAPDCGLRLLDPEVARRKLTRMVAAAQAVRAEL
ncbi:MAG TPA: uroporphyrinogen decarboxylase family protein [Ktedonobacterales bacterium]|nr:uroporphyrinogen decarboxylase family protein [Ktedonobacterales bacterium]